MHHPHPARFIGRHVVVSSLVIALIVLLPGLALAQASPFMTGATALQTNIVAWLTPIAIILVMVLGGMAMANRMSWGWCIGAIFGISQVSGIYGAAAAQTIVENCSNTLILRCSSSENGGTSHFASKLIGDREVVRRQTTRGSDREGGFSMRGARRSKNTSEQHVIEAAVMPSQIEQLPDLTGYLKTASSPAWHRVTIEQRTAARIS